MANIRFKFNLIFILRLQTRRHEVRRTEICWQLNQLPPPLERLCFLGWPHFPETVSVAALWVHFKLIGITLKLVELMVKIAIHLKTFAKQ